ncbi:hypothetical protein DPMN_154584 [Dreissena polymorpha]|uniref:Uncharacterized protein n=1 Tax=Dreissena polymorpha TaxID=45954 RepID=A0A9D4FMW3_DREPO|nr:hypothetical protein DPMN_154584 [Dreissena polymorpha]
MNRTFSPKPRRKQIVTLSDASLATTGLPTKVRSGFEPESTPEPSDDIDHMILAWVALPI